MLHETIKTATTIDHQNAEKHSYGKEIMSKTLTKEQYSQLIIANYMFVSSWEKQWTESRLDLANLKLSKRKKMESLHLDLKELGIDPTSIVCVDLPEPESIAQFYGRMYVIEGSTLGGAMISKQLQQNNNLDGLTFNFYKGYGANLIPNWKEFLVELNTITDKQEQETAVLWAKDAFKAMENCFIKAQSLERNS